MSEAWKTKRELAAELGISVRTIERLRLPHMRVGGQNRYLRTEVERFLRVGETGGNVVVLRPDLPRRVA